MAEWEDDEDETTSEEDEVMSRVTSSTVESDIDWEEEEGFGGEFDIIPRFFTSFGISPEAEDLPSPFFPPSRNSTPSLDTFDSLSPDANDLPQPRFDSDLQGFAVIPPPRIRGAESPPSLTSESLGSIVSPDPEDLPLPCFEIYARFELEELEHPGYPHHKRINEEGVLDRIREWAAACGRFCQVENGGYEDLNTWR